ncbi:hypothetical protein [Bradyrhizobium sp. 1]|uniref:hypothetical protein n=1 Tax=Bradyrhizobium sp. 1 TaxID=241591 RepID=UPI001FFC1678|nr:hypothetical protein [Bradyrhizobium sp. 1]MCK1389489.1 hypothetical protein [Bradyrhizobium sp. 1]
MSAASGMRHLATSGDSSQSGTWRLAPYVFLVALIVLAAYVQKQPSDVLIHPTGPLPAVNIP